MAILTAKLVWRRELAKRTSEIALNSEEKRNVLRAIEHLRYRLGSLRLAKAMGTTIDALRKSRSPRRPPTMRLVVMTAYVAETDVDDILDGTWLRASPCPLCGRHDS